MKASVIEDFSALIGIDWADRKHDICELEVGSKNYDYKVISSNPKTINQWALDVKKRFPNKPVAVACELTKDPLIYALRQHKHLVLFSINSSTVAKYRKALHIAVRKMIQLIH